MIYAKRYWLIIGMIVGVSCLPSPNVIAGSYDWTVPCGTPVIDGNIGSNEWKADGRHVFHRMFSVNSKIAAYMMWDDGYLYMAVSVSDWHLWDEPNQQSWETYNDDSIEWYLDVNYDRAMVMLNRDFIFQAEPNGNTLLGEGTGSRTVGLAANTFSAKTSYMGTLNNNTDYDTGFAVEVMIPWSTLGVTPYDGMPMGTCILRQSDDDGGDWMADTESVTTFYAPNEWVTSRGGESGSNRSPTTWGTVVLSGSSDNSAPAQITDLSAVAEHAYSAMLYFTAPGDNGTRGWASGYNIRYSTDASSYKDYSTLYQPKMQGESEALRILGLQPSTTYHVSVTAVDEAGNEGPLSNSASFTTLAKPDNELDKGFIVPSPNSRYLVTLDNTPFIPNRSEIWLEYNVLT